MRWRASRAVFSLGINRGASSSQLHTSCRALYPGEPSAEANRALQGFHSRYNSKQPASHYFQTIDANQVHLARLTLASLLPLNNDQNEELLLSRNKVAERGPPSKSALIPSEHLCFFTPRVRHDQLGKDGSDTSFNPPGNVFTRRMWAGGEMSFERDNQLCIGDEAWEKTIVEEASWKELKGGRGEMIVVWVKKEIGNHNGVCLTDRRSWIFQPALKESFPSSSSSSTSKEETQPPTTNEEEEAPSSISTPTRLLLDSSSLFRYSALTFNAHAIHLSPPWAQQVEGHPGIVVHGPLNLSLLLRKWGKHVAEWTIDEQGRFVMGQNGKKIKKVVYRAKKPIHAGHPYWIGFSTQQESSSESKLMAVKADGQIAMEATITAW